MWILDSEGDFLGGKRVWLRPGKKYLFGRTQQNGVQHAIEHNSISRKHMIIEVTPVKPGDGSDIHTKSKIVVSDQGSKCGTFVDGKLLKGDSTRLTEDEHTIKLGKYKSTLRIKWEPTVLTFSFSSKELKAKDPLANVRARLEDLDIKTVVPYIVGHTTHVVQNKRNTAKGLQALVNGQYIVQDSYLDALVYAATPSDLENLESLSPLEADFEAAWPSAEEHLPPPGKELAQRPKEAFAPNPDRINVFDGYTFVFGDATQCDNLREPITNGHGKVLLYQIENGVTTADEIVQFMRNAAGRTGLGSQRDGPGGVVYVRYRAKGRYEDWSIELSNEVALGTEQRVIEQSEFLDAILGCDAAPLCRGLPDAPSTAQSGETDVGGRRSGSTPVSAAPVPRSSASASASASADVEVVADSQPTSTQASEAPRGRSKGSRVRSFVSKMKTFDDGFDINSIPAFDAEEGGSPPSMDMEVDAPAKPPSHKHTPPEQDKDEEEDVVASLLPGAAAMKRRRAQTNPRDSADPHPKEASRPPKRPKLAVLEAARQHRAAEEDAARQRRQDEEAHLQSSLQDVDVEKLKGLAIVEEMEIRPRVRSQTRATAGPETNERWDERWNGRKNFKKFRRREREDTQQRPRHHIQTVIVPLEEVTRQDFGIGEHYWGSKPVSTGVSRSRSRSRSRSPSQSRSQSPLSSRSASQSLMMSEPTGSRTGSRTRTQTGTGTRTRTPATTTTPAGRSQKRGRAERESDSEDELRFRFRRRR